MKVGLKKWGHKVSLADPCVFIKHDMVVLVYVDNCILTGKNSTIIESFIDFLQHGDENFDFTEKGSMDRYLGVGIQRLENKEFILRQPFLIQQILKAMDIDVKETNEKSVPVVDPLLMRVTNGIDQKGHWHY